MIETSSRILCMLIFLSAYLTSLCLAAEGKPPSPHTLATNLSALVEYNAKKQPGSKPIAFEKLEKNTSESILAKPRSTDRITWLKNSGAEKKHLSAQRGGVVRSGKTLSLETSKGDPIKFSNMYRRGGNTYEGDSIEYFFAGPLSATGYLMVEAEYMHDSPGRYFVNQKTGSILYAHIGEHSVFLSKNNRMLVINDSLNPPFGLVVAAITEQGHTLELHCLGSSSASAKSQFKGWHGSSDVGFDLTIGEEEANKEFIPIQFRLLSGKWHTYAPEEKIKSLSTRVKCWQ